MKKYFPRLNRTLLLVLSLSTLLAQACNTTNVEKQQKSNLALDKKLSTMQVDTATFAAGCFWCVEAIFLQMKGVEKVVSGYAGGTVKNPSYKEVCTGTTGHAEVVQVIFDPAVVSYKDLLEAFWQTHDPTTLNRQGADVGTQYRSSVFYHNTTQRDEATFYKKQLDESGAFAKPIVTEIVPFTLMYPAEDYHQDYYNQNGNEGYCQFVIRPKVEKFRKAFAAKLK